MRCSILMAEAPPPAVRQASWNPQGISIPLIFDADYCKTIPPHLDGTLAGDIGCDPMCLAALANPTIETVTKLTSVADRKSRILAMSTSEQQRSMLWMKTAELKHARLAMLCAAGWPLSEIVNAGHRAPSLMNGGLVNSPGGTFVAFAFAIAALIEASGAFYGVNGGDYEFDPLGISSGEGLLPASLPNVGKPDDLALAEIKNGRVAMMAVLGMVVQEAVWSTSVVDQTPFFFGR